MMNCLFWMIWSFPKQKCPAFYRDKEGQGFIDVFDNVHEYNYEFTDTLYCL